MSQITENQASLRYCPYFDVKRLGSRMLTVKPADPKGIGCRVHNVTDVFILWLFQCPCDVFVCFVTAVSAGLMLDAVDQQNLLEANCCLTK